jgi:uncharacterized RDD family membrane protein YckC
VLPDPEGGRFGAGLDVTIDLPLATAGSRGLARAIDTLVYLVVQLVTGTVLGVVLYFVWAAGALGPGPLIGLFFLLIFVVQWSLATSVELWMGGQTPGKRLLGLRTVRDDGGTLTMVPALIRNLLRVDSFPIAGLVDLAVMLLHPSSKRIGDLAAGTVVVDEGKPTPPRTWPPALSAADVALLQLWFARAPDLTPARRAHIAGRLVARLAPAYPGLDAAAAPIGALEAFVPLVTPPADLAAPAATPPPAAAPPAATPPPAAAPSPGAPT